jgi:hypothetical protein
MVLASALKIAAQAPGSNARKDRQAFKTTLENAGAFPTWTKANNPSGFALDPAIGKLDEDRDSFLFAYEDLPPAVT